MFKSINTFFERITTVPYSSLLLLFVPIIVACIRILEEELFFGFEGATPYLVHNYVIGYLFVMLMIAGSFHLGTGLDIKKTAGFTSVGLVLGWLPALIDLALGMTEGRVYMYFPTFQWHFIYPEQMLGETITLWFVIAASGVFAFWATRNVLRTVFTCFLIYITLQIYTYGWLKICELFSDEKYLRSTESTSLVGIFLVLLLYCLFNYKTIGPSFKRCNHSFPWGLVSVIGSRLIGEVWTISIVKGIIMALAFQLIVITNDYFDREQDQSNGGKARPVSKDDMIFASYIMVLLALWMLIYHDRAFFLIMVFFALFTAYHLPGLRFKRLFCLNYKIEGSAAMICFVLGIMRFYIDGPMGTIPVHSLPRHSWAIIFSFLVMGGFSLGSMFKDYKDIEQDRFDKIGTFYTRNLKKGRSLSSIHRFICISNTVLFLVPPIWLLSRNEYSPLTFLLFMLAFLNGITLHTVKNKKNAVEGTLWLINIYLLIFVFAISIMKNRLF
ncbi:UbiA family prenyltransferase, partial [bacterium]|nr:UbiA family prenyltransferase [bacterium]